VRACVRICVCACVMRERRVSTSSLSARYGANGTRAVGCRRQAANGVRIVAQSYVARRSRRSPKYATPYSVKLHLRDAQTVCSLRSFVGAHRFLTFFALIYQDVRVNADDDEETVNLANAIISF